MGASRDNWIGTVCANVKRFLAERWEDEEKRGVSSRQISAEDSPVQITMNTGREDWFASLAMTVSRGPQGLTGVLMKDET
jgi:hypothetical protein